MDEDKRVHPHQAIVLFAKALSFILQANEGIVVKFDKQQYVIVKNSNDETIDVVPREDISDFNQSVEEGDMVWLHHEKDETVNAIIDQNVRKKQLAEKFNLPICACNCTDYIRVCAECKGIKD